VVELKARRSPEVVKVKIEDIVRVWSRRSSASGQGGWRERSTIPARERVIVALDVPDLKQPETFSTAWRGQPAFYKVGLELFVAEGARAIEAVRSRGGKVFSTSSCTTF